MKLLLYILCLSLLVSCKKFVQVDLPSNQATTEAVFQSDATAMAAVNGIYGEMMNSSTPFTASSLTFYTGLYADEFLYYSASDLDQFSNSQLTETVHPLIEAYFWSAAYRFIYMSNSCLSQLDQSVSVSDSTRKQLKGEVLFIRAFCYFYLTELFGDVPLVLTTDYRINERMPRTPKASVLQQITSDLQLASTLLPLIYSSNERIRPTYWAAQALLSRVYLYQSNWSAAEAIASTVINSGIHQLVANLNNVFLKNSAEAIWQLLPVTTGNNTWEGLLVLPASASNPPTYYFRTSFLSDMETNDARKNTWITNRTYLSQVITYPSKYKVRNNAPLTEYYMVLRLAEVYLIRSEARAQLNKVADATADLNRIRNRASLANTTANDVASLLTAIEKERKFELMAEWGHRWFDLKRWHRASSILGSIKPATWSDNDTLWPIPQKQILSNPNLIQNPGY